jgi:hypothetical protein
MALMNWAIHMLQWELQNEAIARAGAKRKKFSQFGLDSATRVYEGGIASNRETACHGES